MPRRRNIRITRIIAATGDVAHQFQSLHFSNFRPVAKRWQPAVNAFCRRDGIDLCVDLAGVDKERIEILADPQRVQLRGERRDPAPSPRVESPGGACQQLFLMEIENGPFERILDLPRRIDPGKTTARKEDGYLWIHLPYEQH